MQTQKGFIQIPLLIGIIVAVVIISGVGASVVLYRQGKLTPLVANISQVSTETEEPVATEIKEQECPTCEPCESEIITKEMPVEKIVVKEVVKEVPVEKIVYKEICSCPQIQPEILEEQEEQSVTYSGSEFGGKIHDYFPVITSFSAEPSPNVPLKIGDEIHLKVEVHEPKGRQVLYKWWCLTCDFNRGWKWTTNPEIRYRITSEDVRNSGESMRIGVYIKSEKEYYRTGSHDYDDGIYTDYKFSF